ncbi:hypothetical protein AVEN_1174-1 [Araneus ventricosus]|uniref:Uncharacterized protein n=1 Tax=Araneus ventricosus TaxID=182803 RepID=A0A4Y2EE71_ARAVE|nr:hypothetical protein AVEN_1174-1 [Araneus ventricosus]
MCLLSTAEQNDGPVIIGHRLFSVSDCDRNPPWNLFVRLALSLSGKNDYLDRSMAGAGNVNLQRPVGESRAISDRSLDVHSRKNPREIYGPYVGGYESHIFHVSPRARRRDCPRESLTGKAIVASFGAFGHPITTARHSVPFIFIFSYYDPAYGLPRAGPSRNFISAVAAAGLQGRPTVRHPQIMGLESPGQSLKVYCFFAPAPSVFFFYFSPFGSLFLLGSPGAVTPFSTVLRHLADRYWLLDKYTLCERASYNEDQRIKLLLYYRNLVDRSPSAQLFGPDEEFLPVSLALLFMIVIIFFTSPEHCRFHCQM